MEIQLENYIDVDILFNGYTNRLSVNARRYSDQSNFLIVATAKDTSISSVLVLLDMILRLKNVAGADYEQQGTLVKRNYPRL